MASSCVRGGSGWILGKMSFLQELAQAAQGSGGVPIPGGVQTPCGCGPWGQGSAGMVGLGWWLDLMISEVFSNLSDSMIP